MFICVWFFFLLFHSQRDNEAKNADDVLFDMFRNETTDLLPIGKFLAVSYRSMNCLNINRRDDEVISDYVMLL